MKIRIPLEVYLKEGGVLKNGDKLFTNTDEVIVGEYCIYKDTVATTEHFTDFSLWFEIEVEYIPETLVKNLINVLDNFPELDKPVLRDILDKMVNSETSKV